MLGMEIQYRIILLINIHNQWTKIEFTFVNQINTNWDNVKQSTEETKNESKSDKYWEVLPSEHSNWLLRKMKGRLR